jgi:hypothetical protein
VCVRVGVELEKRDERNGQALSLNITYGSAPCSSSSDTIFTLAKPVAMISAVMCPVTPRLGRPSFRTRDWRHRELSGAFKINRDALADLISTVQRRVVYVWPYNFILTLKDTVEKMETFIAGQLESIDTSVDANVLLESAMENHRVIADAFEMWNSTVRQLGHGQFGLCVTNTQERMFISQ